MVILHKKMKIHAHNPTLFPAFIRTYSNFSHPIPQTFNSHSYGYYQITSLSLWLQLNNKCSLSLTSVGTNYIYSIKSETSLHPHTVFYSTTLQLQLNQSSSSSTLAMASLAFTTVARSSWLALRRSPARH